MSVNRKNNQAGNEIPSTEPAADQTVTQIPGSTGEAGGPFVVLDDIAAPSPSHRLLVSNDLKLLRAMQSILEKRQTDAWIDEMRAQISAELEWSEA